MGKRGWIGMLAILLLAGGGLGLYAVAKKDLAVDLAALPTIVNRLGIGGGTESEQAGREQGLEQDGEPARASTPEFRCAGPLPKQTRVQYTPLPEGKLGEWLSVKNEAGREALRFKVDLIDTAEIGTLEQHGRRVPIIAGLFTLQVENRSCEDLKWSLRRSGLWLGVRRPHPKDILVAWASSSSFNGDAHGFLVQEGGKFNTDDENDIFPRLLLEKKFGRTTPLKELPNPVRPNQRGEAEFLIHVSDPYRKLGDVSPVGLYGDGRLHLALGGELSWALIDLGRAEDWLKLATE